MHVLPVITVAVLALIFQLIPVSSRNLRNHTIDDVQVMTFSEPVPMINENYGIIIPTILKYSRFEDTCILIDPKHFNHIEVPCLLFLRNSLKQFSLSLRYRGVLN